MSDPRFDRTLIRVVGVQREDDDRLLSVEIVGYDEAPQPLSIRQSRLGFASRVGEETTLVGEVTLLASPEAMRFRSVGVLPTPGDDIMRIFGEAQRA